MSTVDTELRLTLRESIERMRAIPALWKHLAHPIQEMQRIREDPDYNPWAEPQFAARFAPCCAGCNCRERIAAMFPKESKDHTK